MSSESAQPNLSGGSESRGFSFRFWLLVPATGIVAGLCGGALMRLLFLVQHLAWHDRGGDVVAAASRASPPRRVLMLFGAGVLVGVGGWIIRRLLGKPGKVDAAIWFRSGRVPFLPTIAQAVQSIIAVGMGMSLGREASIKETGGAIAGTAARWASLPLPQQRVLVACGVGAGMAAAYNVPLGGALFAGEVLLGTLSLRLVLPAMICSVCATAASWALLSTGPIYRVPEFPLSASLTCWAVLAGPPCGLAAVGFVRAIGWASARRPAGSKALIAPIVALTALGAASIVLPQLLGNGKDLVQLAFADQVSIVLLLVLPLMKLLATSACLGSGAHGGLFTPTMTVGALLGGLLGHAWHSIAPGAPIGCCAVIGSGAFLCAVTQGPVSSVALVLELTRHVDSTMAPMLLAVCGAMLTVRRFETRSVYSICVPRVLIAVAPHRRGRTRFEKFMNYQVPTVSSAEGLPEITLRLLDRSADNSSNWCVVDHEGKLTGQISRHVIASRSTHGVPFTAAVVADIATPIIPATSEATEEQIEARFKSDKLDSLPVIDSRTGRLLGVAEKRRVFLALRSEAKK